MAPHFFLLDENVLVRAIALGSVDYQGGRYVRTGNADGSALALLVEIDKNGHNLALSNELWGRYSAHRTRLQEGGFSVTPHPMDLINGLWGKNRIEFSPSPPTVELPGSFPSKDLYLAYLSLAKGAALVTGDGGIHAAAANTALGFEVLSISDALERARQPA